MEERNNEHDCAEVYTLVEGYVHAEIAAEVAVDSESQLTSIDEEQINTVLRQVVVRCCQERAPEQLKEQVLARLRGLSA